MFTRILKWLFLAPIYLILGVAAPQYATMTFVSRKKTYTKDIYLSDVSAALIKWDAGDGASSTSPDNWQTPEGVRLVDFSIPTGMTDTKGIVITLNGIQIGDFLRYANHLNTSYRRNPLFIPINGGTKVGAIQKT